MNYLKSKNPYCRPSFLASSILFLLFSSLLHVETTSGDGNETSSKQNKTALSSDAKETCSGPTCCTGNGNNSEGCPLKTKLLLVQVIHRHGDRTPLFSYPTDPHKNSSSMPMLRNKRKGLLTKRGKVQAYELGTYLASRYKDFLEGMWIPEELLVHSSMSERAIMTAQVVLAGMFFPLCSSSEPGDPVIGCETKWSREIKWQPIPVYPIPRELDNKILFSPERCPAYQAELQNVLECDVMQEFLAEKEEVFAYVKNHTGLEEISMMNIGRVYDTLFIQNSYDLQLPNWTSTVFPEPMKTIEELGFQVLSGTRKMIRLNGGPLLRQVIDNMKTVVKQLMILKCRKRKRKNIRPKKVFVFSGHDTTVSSFLSALNVFEIHQPPYASAVMVELHQIVGKGEEDENDGKGSSKSKSEKLKGVSMKDMIVKVFYRNSSKDTPKEMIIPGCGNPCFLEELEFVVSDLLISDLEWEVECQDVDGFFSLKPLEMVISIILKLVWSLASFVFGCFS